MIGDVSALWSFSSQLSDLELQVEDTAEIGLRFQKGVIGSVHLNYTQIPASHRLEIVGATGTIRWDNADGAVKCCQSDKAEWETFPVPPDFERNQLFLSQMQHFVNVVEGKTESLCTLTDGVKALQLALAAHQSQDSGRLVRM
jgi:predicted dehydrogenase